MSNYTEADVNEAAQLVEEGLHTTTKVNPRKDVWLPKLAFLKFAALEGAKVPGLVAELKAAYELVHALEEHRPGAKEVGATVRALQARVITLTADKDAVRSQLNRVHGHLVAIAKNLGVTDALSGSELETAALDISKERDALQARVAELELQLELKEAQRATAFRIGNARVAERDALCAQVAQAVAIASGVSNRMPDDVAGAVCRDILAALSAPPAETTPAPERRKRTCARHTDCDAADSLAVKLSNNVRAVAEHVPERAERSCNLHADCEAADISARAGGDPDGDEHCNDADCPDHQ